MTAPIDLSTKAAVKINVNTVSGGASGGGVSAHSALTGLTTGDDHTQYQRSKSVFTSATSYTVTEESAVITTGTAVVLPGAAGMAGRQISVGAAAGSVTVSPAGSDSLWDNPGSPYVIPIYNAVSWTSVQISGDWGWAIATRNGGAFDMPAWYGLALAAGKVLRIDGTGAPAWANIDAADVPSLPASKITSGTFDVARLPAASTSAQGAMSSTDKSKLDGIATGATANSSDATLLNRANHTGTQAAGTITGLAAVATSGSASDLTTGTVPSARLSSKAVGGQGAGSTLTEPLTATSLLTSTVTLPACAAGDVLLVSAGINFTQSTGASRNVTFALKLGATTMLSTGRPVASGTGYQAHLNAAIRVLTTTSQTGSMSINWAPSATGSTGLGAGCTGTAAETISSGTLALDLTLLTSASGATQTFQLTSLSVVKVAA